MSRPIGKIFGLDIFAKPSAFVGFVGVWLALSAIAWFMIQLSPVESIVGGLVCACLHWLSEFMHNLGHAGAARRTGYPMRGILYVHVLAVSLYPPDEPTLPARIHIRRALGGPVLSFVITIIAFLILLIAQFVGGMFYWIALWLFLDNLFVFTLGALMPFPFSDGGTLMRYRRES